MKLSDVIDDDDIEMEEFEGLVTVNKNQRNSNVTRVSTVRESGSNYRGRVQMILILLAIIGAFIVGRDSDAGIVGKVVSEGEVEEKDIGLILRGKSSTTSPVPVELVLDENKDKDTNGLEPVLKDESSTVAVVEEKKAEENKEEAKTADIQTPDPGNEPISSTEEQEKKETDTTPDKKEAAPTENESALEGAKNITGESKNAYDVEKWGKWKFYDGGADIRPTEDYCAKYPNRDIPGDDFPENAWQTDAVYVNHFINEGLNEVQRVQEAILAEYGHEKKEGMTPAELVERRKMFQLTYLDVEKEENPPKGPDNAGCTTKKSFDGLVKRLLHALLTNDSFTVVMGGHSAAAGHGNHFKQSYMMEFFHTLEPVFSRLGVKLVARNIAQGGLGTMQTALGAKSLYGEEVDVIVWDSSMTENSNSAYDLFARQSLLGSNRAPVLYHGFWKSLKRLNVETSADVFIMGNGNAGLPITINEEQALTLPWATRYMVCDKTRKDLCKANKYRTKCWVDRPDFTPVLSQDPHVGSQVSWHPGFRTHQLTSRVMAFVVLDALESALSIWSENTIVGGHPLSDEHWHITDYYNSIQNKAKGLNHTEDGDGCENIAFPSRVCNLPLNGRTEFTPRANPNETSILSILKPKPDGSFPSYAITKMLYDGPDVANPALSIPDDAIDVHAIGGGRRNLQSSFHRRVLDASFKNTNPTHQKLEESIAIVQGNWSFSDDIPPGTCGGEYNDICGRVEGDKCLLSGHMDHRGGVRGDSTSGWLVMELKNVVHGFVMIKIESWHGNKLRRLEDLELDKYLCDEFIFEYAINGKITTLNKSQFTEIKTHPQRVVEVFPILDDESMVEQDLEFAIQIRGCENAKKPTKVRFHLTHVYWA